MQLDAVDMRLVEKIACLPVVEHDRLVGLISETGCLRHLSHLLANGGVGAQRSRVE